MVNSNFFLNLDLESSEAEDGSIQTVFQNETYALSKDNSDYVKNLRRQLDALDRLKRKSK